MAKGFCCSGWASAADAAFTSRGEYWYVRPLKKQSTLRMSVGSAATAKNVVREQADRRTHCRSACAAIDKHHGSRVSLQTPSSRNLLSRRSLSSASRVETCPRQRVRLAVDSRLYEIKDYRAKSCVHPTETLAGLNLCGSPSH